MPTRQDKMNQEIDSKRQRLRSLFQELRQRHFMTTWIGIVSYVLLALSTKSPVFAAQLLLRLSGHDAVELEIRGLQNEIQDDLRNVRDEEDRDLRQRQFAASMILRQQMQERSIEADIGRLRMQMDMKIAAAGEKNPEIEAALRGLQRDFRNYSVLATKFGTAARDPMTGEVRDKNADALYRQYLKKMQDVQAEIEKFE